MDSVPFAFYDSFIRYSFNSVQKYCKFPGIIGTAASWNFENLTFEKISIVNGKLVESGCKTCFGEVSVNNRHGGDQMLYADIKLSERNRDAKEVADPDVLQAITACKHHDVRIHFFLPHLNEALENSICSLRGTLLLWFGDRSSADFVSKMIRIFITKKNVRKIGFPRRYKLNGVISALLLDVLSQEQFNSMILPDRATSVVSDILAYWRISPEKLIGKEVRIGMIRNEVLNIDFGIADATEQEIAHLQLYYPQMKPQKSCQILILRSEQGAAAYFINCHTLFFA